MTFSTWLLAIFQQTHPRFAGIFPLKKGADTPPAKGPSNSKYEDSQPTNLKFLCEKFSNYCTTRSAMQPMDDSLQENTQLIEWAAKIKGLFVNYTWKQFLFFWIDNYILTKKACLANFWQNFSWKHVLFRTILRCFYLAFLEFSKQQFKRSKWLWELLNGI